MGKDIIRAGLDTASELAKAEQEQQKTLQKTLDFGKQIGEFLGHIFKPAANELGEVLGDQARYWRFKNLVRILGNAQKIVEERGITPEQLKSLPFSDAIRTIEAASSEDEEAVQDIWTRLIANAVDPTRAVAIKKLYIDVLKSLSSSEVLFLDLLWQCERRLKFTTLPEIKAFNEDMNKVAEERWRKVQEEERGAAIQNLVRIRCVTFRPRPIDMTNLFAVLPREQNQSAFQRWAATDPQKFEKVINAVGELIFVAAGVKDYTSSDPIPLRSFLSGMEIKVPEMNFMLTPIGNALMNACTEKAPTA